MKALPETRRMKHPAFLYVAAVLCLLVSGYACNVAPAAVPARSDPAAPAAAWAVKMEAEHLDNLHRVSQRLFRGEQPTAAGFSELRKLGIKTIVNLRAFHTDDDEIQAAGLQDQLVLKRISFKTWHPEMEDIEAFLEIVTEPANDPIYLHCMHGSDRTGTMCAIYRIVVDGWDREAAIDEMVHGGFGFHSMWQNLIDFIRNDLTDADIARWRARVAQKRR